MAQSKINQYMGFVEAEAVGPLPKHTKFRKECRSVQENHKHFFQL